MIRKSMRSIYGSLRGLMINIGVDERLIGIEVLDVSSAIGKHGMANYLVETIPVAPA